MVAKGVIVPPNHLRREVSTRRPCRAQTLCCGAVPSLTSSCPSATPHARHTLCRHRSCRGCSEEIPHWIVPTSAFCTRGKLQRHGGRKLHHHAIQKGCDRQGKRVTTRLVHHSRCKGRRCNPDSSTWPDPLRGLCCTHRNGSCRCSKEPQKASRSGGGGSALFCAARQRW